MMAVLGSIAFTRNSQFSQCINRSIDQSINKVVKQSRSKRASISCNTKYNPLLIAFNVSNSTLLSVIPLIGYLLSVEPLHNPSIISQSLGQSIIIHFSLDELLGTCIKLQINFVISLQGVLNKFFFQLYYINNFYVIVFAFSLQHLNCVVLKSVLSNFNFKWGFHFYVF